MPAAEMDTGGPLRRSSQSKPEVNYAVASGESSGEEAAEQTSSGEEYRFDEDDDKDESDYGGDSNGDDDDLSNSVARKKYNFATSVVKCNASSTYVDLF